MRLCMCMVTPIDMPMLGSVIEGDRDDRAVYRVSVRRPVGVTGEVD